MEDGHGYGDPRPLAFLLVYHLCLITWSLSTYYFPEAAPDLPLVSYWLKGALAAFLLFASVALHLKQRKLNVLGVDFDR